MTNRIKTLTLLAICLFCGTTIKAQENENETLRYENEELRYENEDETLRYEDEDENGDETLKAEFGLELTTEQQLTHKGEYNFANLLKLQASIPLCKTLTLDASSISTYMTSDWSIGEDLQIFSNLDAENIPFAFSVFGFDWHPSEHHSLFLGIRNMNEDYFCSDVTSLFTNSSCGLYPTISANCPIANYPYASVGVHYRYNKGWGDDDNHSAIILQGSLYNGIAYRRFSGRDNIFRFCPKDDGIFGIAQVEYQHRGSSYFLGASHHSDNGTALWSYAEQRLSDDLTLIAGYSHAFGSSRLCTDFAGIGAKYSWMKCLFGLFTDYARFTLDEDLSYNEFATELTCKIQLSSHFYLQPSAHIIAGKPSDSDYSDFFTTFNTAYSLRLGVRF